MNKDLDDTSCVFSTLQTQEMLFTWCISVSPMLLKAWVTNIQGPNFQSSQPVDVRPGSAKLRSIPARPAAGGPVVDGGCQVVVCLCFVQEVFGAQICVVQHESMPQYGCV